ncbi:hypothetical protein [Flavobacterium sp. 245]|nr:hypothetical protein [Flavobacterium sp. 245]
MTALGLFQESLLLNMMGNALFGMETIIKNKSLLQNSDYSTAL